MKRALPMIGCLFPLLLGAIIELYMLTDWYYNIAAIPIGIAVLVIWFFLGFFFTKYFNSIIHTTIAQNFPALVILLLILLSQIFSGFYSLDQLGSGSQMFYLPLMSMAVSLTIGHRIFPAFIVAFFLLLITSFAGCVVGERRRK